MFQLAQMCMELKASAEDRVYIVQPYPIGMLTGTDVSD